MGFKRLYGKVSETNDFKEFRKPIIYASANYLKVYFENNAELLNSIGLSVTAQLKEIEQLYGLKISAAYVSELKAGKRYKCGFLLLTTIKHYWKVKGYDIKIGL